MAPTSTKDFVATFAATASSKKKADHDDTVPTGSASVSVDLGSRSLQYDFTKVALPAKCVLRIHGFAPPGWDVPPLAVLPVSNSPVGAWSFPKGQEKNVLSGLAYFTLCGRPTVPSDEKSTGPSESTSLRSLSSDGPKFRAQIVPSSNEKETLEDSLVRDFMSGGASSDAGGCAMSVELFGMLERTPVIMEPAQVQLVRSPAEDFDGSGRLASKLNITVRTGAGFVEKVGKVQVEIFEGDSPGMVQAHSKESVFPASMVFHLRKRYHTQFGTLIGERESYIAEKISQFPPYGTHIRPTSEVVRLLDEKSGKHVGNMFPGSIIPLFNIPSDSFPLKSVPEITPAGDKPRMYKMVPAE